MPNNKPRQRLYTWDKLTLYTLTKLTIAGCSNSSRFTVAEIRAKAIEFIESGFANVSTHPSSVTSAITASLNRFVELHAVERLHSFALGHRAAVRYNFRILQSDRVVRLCNAIYEASTSTGLSLNARNSEDICLAYSQVLAKYHESRETLEVSDKLVLYAIDRLQSALQHSATKREIKEKVKH